MKEARNGGRPNGRLIPAVEYLRSQRVRMMMMMKLAEATANVDVYVVAANPSVGGGPPATTTASEPPRPTTPQSPAQRHFAMANLARNPAINLPNGFLEAGSPTNVTSTDGRSLMDHRVGEGAPGCGRDPEASGRARHVTPGNLVIGLSGNRVID
jgi:Asp-tRNA(Asn)/Glu-tRNA(Gln) amidotransferase A subunit family amidase